MVILETKGNLMILVCFLAGVFVGLGDFAPEWLLGHDLPIIILSLLIVQVGISLGSNNDLRGLFHSLNPRMSLLPVFTIGGTLLFSAIGVFLLHGRDLNDCLTIGSGFGYYSLSSVLIADIKVPLSVRKELPSWRLSLCSPMSYAR